MSWSSDVERVLDPLATAIALLFTFLARLSSRRAGLVLRYHRVDREDGDPARELVPAVAVQRFAAQVRFLMRCYRVVAAAELQAETRRRRRGQRFPVAITLDDDSPSHLRARDVLVECGAPATLFLTGASLDGPRRFWWELVQEAFDRGLSLDDVVASTSAGPASIHDLAERIKRMPPEQRREADVALRRLVGEAPEGGLQRDQVAALGADLAVGFHTRDHDFLPSVPEQDVGHAVGAGVDAVQAAVRTPVTLFAYPHGGSDKSIAAAVRAQGFTQAFTTRAEAVTPRSDPLLLGRWEPPTGISRAGFGFALVRLLYAAR